MLVTDTAEPERGARVAEWLRDNLGRNAAKRIQAEQKRANLPIASDRTVDRILAGQVSDRQTWHLIRVFGWDLATFLLQPICGSADHFSKLDAFNHDLRSAAAASSHSLRHGMGLSLPSAGRRAGDDRDCLDDAGHGDHLGRREAADPDALAVSSPVGRAARELMALCGRLELHEPISIEACDPRHAQLLEAWGSSGGEMTPGFIALMDRLGLAELASVYTLDVKVQRIGAGTLFWTEEQRKAVIGKSIFEMPAAPSFTRAVYDRLVDTVARKHPNNTLLTFDTGVTRATWKRMAFAFPLSGCIVGSPALQGAA